MLGAHPPLARRHRRARSARSAAVDERLAARAAGRHPGARPARRRPSSVALFRDDGREGLRDRRARRRGRRRAGGGRRLPARAQPAGRGRAWATIRCSPACRGQRDDARRRDAAAATAATRSALSHALRRRRRDRHAGAGLRPRQPDDAQLPARDAHRRAARRATSSAATRRSGACCARATARARMPRTVNMDHRPVALRRHRAGDLMLGAHGPRRLHIVVVG